MFRDKEVRLIVSAALSSRQHLPSNPCVNLTLVFKPLNPMANPNYSDTLAHNKLIMVHNDNIIKRMLQ
jgi:hypothetical protein